MSVHIVVGGQYGSEAKGHVAWRVARDHHTHYMVRIGGPNAGHTVYDRQGNRFALRQIPVGAILPDVHLVIAAGSEIDTDVLDTEISTLEQAGHDIRGRLLIDRNATIIEQIHKDTEQFGGMNSRLGSTAKGIGAARADKLMRKALTAEQAGLEVCDTQTVLGDADRRNAGIVIEGTQGYGLGLSAGHYPYATSGNCRAIDFLSQAGLWPQSPPDVWIVYRTYPIRVAGNSGPMHSETTWEDLAALTSGYVQPERTTVTQKIRRVGVWDPDLARRSYLANSGAGRTHLALMFADYWEPSIAGTEDPPPADLDTLWGSVRSASVDTTGAPDRWEYLGSGPTTIIDMLRRPS